MTAASAGSYRPDIDGLRAIAVLMVVGFHAFPSAVTGGFVGVDIFFVISGYLITGILLARLGKGRYGLTEFYSGRVRRLFPALSLVLAATFVLGWIFLMPDEFELIGKHILAGAGFVSNFVLWHEVGYFDTVAETKPLLHLWSLGVEEQFYLLWPALLWLAWQARFNLRLAVGVVLLASLAADLLTVSSSPAFAFYWPFTRFWELMAGAWLACPAPERKFLRPEWKIPEVGAVLGFVLIFAGMLLFDRASPYPGWRALLPAAGAALLIASGARSRLAAYVLDNRAAVGIGLISYPLYLWHWPLLSIASIRDDAPSVPLRAAIVVASVLLAWLTYRFVEKPIRFGALRPKAVPLCIAMMLVAVAAGCFAYFSGGAPLRFANPIRAVVTYRSHFATDYRYAEGCWLSMKAPSDGFGPTCFAQGGPGKPALVLWGDSYAAALLPGVTGVLGETHAIAQFNRDGCPPVLDSSYEICNRSNEFLIKSMTAASPDTVILAANWAADFDIAAPSVLPKIVETIQAMREAGVHRIVVVGPAPQWPKALPRLIFRQAGLLGDVPQRMPGGADGRPRLAEGILKQAVAQTGVSYVSLLDLLCNADGCLSLVPGSSGVPTASDMGHLTAPAAIFAVRHMRDAGLLR